ncbi:hypothetical protein AGMMS49587_04390 [Spirochaetia bacterium]|nr:hypothetical protein AGMMS49587_04390 [Spirochaetia bacterium]
MVNRRKTLVSALLFLSLSLAAPLDAQVEPEVPSETVYGEGDFFIAWNDGGPRFIQRLSWNRSELALRCEVILEELKGEEHTELLRQSSQDNSLLVSLRPGRYRYQVGVYNLLNQKEYTTDWIVFEVLPALQPRIDRFSPTELSLDDGDQFEITVNGEDIVSGADIRLRLKGTEGQGIRPQSTQITGNRARLVFDCAAFTVGDYEVHVRNPGGLEDSRGVLNIFKPDTPDTPETPVKTGLRRPDFMISAMYAPVVPLYGNLFVPGAFEQTFFPQGAALRLGVLPFKLGGKGPPAKGPGHYFGAELGGSWYMLKEEKERYTLGAQVLGIQLRALYQLWLPGRIVAFNFRAGAGLTAVMDFYYDNGDGKKHFSGEYLSLEGGISFQIRMASRLFIEIGADFTHILSPDDLFPPGYIRPTLGVLWQF